PDIVLRKHNAVLLIHGCFWHGHDCHLFKWPSSRVDFWRSKITRNKIVDERAITALRSKGWRIGIIWECALKGKYCSPLEEIILQCHNWLYSNSEFIVIKGCQ